MSSIYQFLDTNGDGSGTKVATGDYSGAVEEFYIEAPTDTKYRLTRMIVQIRDTAINADDYGAISTGLTNGIEVQVKSGSNVLLDLTDNLPIKTNAHWARFCYDAQAYGWGAGNDFLGVRWTFEKAGGPVVLYPGQRLAVLVNDNLTGLLDHTFSVNGVAEAGALW